MFKFITAILLMCFSFAAQSGKYINYTSEFSGEKSVFFESTKAEHSAGGVHVLFAKVDDYTVRVLLSPGRVVDCDNYAVKVRLADGTITDYTAEVADYRMCYFNMPVSDLKGTIRFKVPMYNAVDRVTNINMQGFDINRLK
jgi:hypothetical protein